MCVFELTYIICTGLFILTDPMSQQREVADDLYLSNPFDRRVRWEIKNDDVIIGPTMHHAQFNSIQFNSIALELCSGRNPVARFRCHFVGWAA